jgi:hypothetical protein
MSACAVVPFLCRTCGADSLEAVFDGEMTNFWCTVCHDCWHDELGWVHRVDRQTCPGCEHHDECIAVDDALASRPPRSRPAAKEVRPGDTIRVRVEGDRRPPLDGVVVEVRSSRNPDPVPLLVVRRSDGGGVLCIPRTDLIETGGPLPEGIVR